MQATADTHVMCMHLYSANKKKVVSWDPKKDPHQILPDLQFHLGLELQQFLPRQSHHEQSQNLIKGNHTLKLSTLHGVVSRLKVSYQS